MTTEGGRDAAEPDAPVLLGEEEAACLIGSVSHASLFAVLKDIEFILPLKRVFAGFQVKQEGLKNPIAHRRLITELINNAILADAVRDAALGKPILPSPPLHKTAPVTAPPPPKPRRDEQMIAERDRLKRELREAQAALRQQSSLVAETRKEIALLQERHAALKQEVVAEQNQRSWLERRLHRQERELGDARAVARKGADHQAGSPSAAHEAAAKKPPESPTRRVDRPVAQDPMTRALERLLSRHKIETVDLVTDEMLRENGGDIAARRIRALVRIAQGSKAAALDDLRFIFETHLSGGDMTAATCALVQSSAVTGSPDPKMATLLFARLSKHPDLVKDAAAVLLTIEGTTTYAALRNICKPPLADRLFSVLDNAVGTASLPAALRAAIGDDITPLRLVQAIDRGEARLVLAAHAFVQRLDKAARELLEQGLADVSDASYFRLLTRRELAGPAIIDVSNVANYERELMATDRPLLANVLAVRASLRERGYFPLTLIADANLPYLIDQSDKFRHMVQSDEAQLVISGTDADEIIVREAKRLHALIVTNDYMADWDPNGEIEKVQYSISLTDGKATLYF